MKRGFIFILILLLTLPLFAAQQIPSGVTDQRIYFSLVDSTDHVTPETGISSFTVYRSRNGGSAAAMTTPTVSELDATNMPGVYTLLCDEDTTIDSGDAMQTMVYSIAATGCDTAHVAIEIIRPSVTAGETLTVSSGNLPTLADGGFTDLIIDSILTDTNETQGKLPATTIAAASDVPSAADNADAIWDEDLSLHDGASTSGEALMEAKTNSEYSKNRVELALPSAAPNAAGGLLITAAGSQDVDTALGYLDASVSSIESPINIPVSQVAVPPSRTWRVTRKSAGLVGEEIKGIQVGESQPFAIDFFGDLPTNGSLEEFTSITIKTGTSGGVTFDTDNLGVDKSQAKVTVTGVAAGTYVLNVICDYQDAFGGGTVEADVTLKVNE